MQRDEEVGKVASLTPVVISKALEIFLKSLIDAGAEEARSSNVKRLTALHLKNCIKTTEKFDFLRSLAEKVPDTVAVKEQAPSKKQKKKDPLTSDE